MLNVPKLKNFATIISHMLNILLHVCKHVPVFYKNPTAFKIRVIFFALAILGRS